jgi:hypothetical protein
VVCCTESFSLALSIRRSTPLYLGCEARIPTPTIPIGRNAQKYSSFKNVIDITKPQKGVKGKIQCADINDSRQKPVVRKPHSADKRHFSDTASNPTWDGRTDDPQI